MPPPAAERDGNHASHVAVERDQRRECFLGDPVERELRAMRADVGDERERVNDVAERGGADDENRAHRPPDKDRGALRPETP